MKVDPLPPLHVEEAFEYYNNLSEGHSVEDLRNVFSYPPLKHVILELRYTPPWIDDQLMDYSLRGIHSIQV